MGQHKRRFLYLAVTRYSGPDVIADLAECLVLLETAQAEVGLDDPRRHARLGRDLNR